MRASRPFPQKQHLFLPARPLVTQMARVENPSRAAGLSRELYLCIGAILQAGNARMYLRWVEKQGGFGGILVPPRRWMVADWDSFEFKFVLTELAAEMQDACLVRTLVCTAWPCMVCMSSRLSPLCQ